MYSLQVYSSSITSFARNVGPFRPNVCLHHPRWQACELAAVRRHHVGGDDYDSFRSTKMVMMPSTISKPLDLSAMYVHGRQFPPVNYGFIPFRSQWSTTTPSNPTHGAPIYTTLLRLRATDFPPPAQVRNSHENNDNPLQALPMTAIHTFLQQLQHVLYNVDTSIEQVDPL